MNSLQVSVLRFVADNPKSNFSYIKLNFIKLSITNTLKCLVENKFLVMENETYDISDLGKSLLNSLFKPKKKMRDSAGTCTKCGKYSTRLSFFKKEFVCPDCLNAPYDEPVYKSRSMIYDCRFV